MHNRTLPTPTDSVCACRFIDGARVHHDELLRVPTELAMAVELLELATSWREIDYSGETLIPPADWLSFATEHIWPDPDLAHRLFGLAVDIARRGTVLSRC